MLEACVEAMHHPFFVTGIVAACGVLRSPTLDRADQGCLAGEAAVSSALRDGAPVVENDGYVSQAMKRCVP